MSTQPEALRLAEFYEALAEEPPKSPDNSNIRAAAAELRRLHTENERLHQINQSHEMKLSVRGYEIQIADLEAQRDALLEALKTARALITEAALTGFNPMHGDWPKRLFASQQATSAVIKAVEEGK